MKSVMKRMTMAACGLSLVVAVGVFPLATPAEATSTKQIGLPVLTGTGGVVSFFLGEDGGVWYTVTSPGGLGLGVAPNYAPTGNPGNPFDQPAATGQGVGGACTFATGVGCNGFVSGAAGALPAACAATGDTCSGFYARIPGAGSFVDAPTVNFPAAGFLGPLCVNTAQITMTGGDNQFWYTRFDSFAAGGAPPAVYDAGCPDRDPFNGATENLIAGAGTSTGFVASAGLTGLIAQCATDARTCVGVWVRFP